MLVGPRRDFSCPHCGALYKLVRAPKLESNRLDYDRISCVQCGRGLSPNVFMVKGRTTRTQAQKLANASEDPFSWARNSGCNWGSRNQCLVKDWVSTLPRSAIGFLFLRSAAKLLTKDEARRPTPNDRLSRRRGCRAKNQPQLLPLSILRRATAALRPRD